MALNILLEDATDEQLAAEREYRNVKTTQAQRDADAASLQEFINTYERDEDSGIFLLSDAGFTAEVHPSDENYVVVNFPTDPVGQPQFFAGWAREVIEVHNGIPMSDNLTKVAQLKYKWESHLTRIAMAL
tara:strand:+ start:86 stop:475 length:390 start_codon:yes stop_codon:yes gene_type:complete